MTKNILVVSPHTDDGELGCGGAISRFSDEGYNVSYVALSCCENSIPDNYPRNILKKEVAAATKVLGIEEVILLEYEVRKFPQFRQEILDKLINLKKEIKPVTVFTPSSYDTHQDHKVTREETLRAFKQCTILGYEQPWNNISFNTLAFVSLKEKNVSKKIEALKCYSTQKDRPYFNYDFIKGLATTRGTQIEEKYAEAFEVIKWVLR